MKDKNIGEIYTIGFTVVFLTAFTFCMIYNPLLSIILGPPTFIDYFINFVFSVFIAFFLAVLWPLTTIGVVVAFIKTLV